MDSLFIVDQYTGERSVKVLMDSQTRRIVRLGKNCMFISRFSVLTLTIPPHNFLFPHLKMYYKTGGKEGGKQHFLKYLHIRIPFICPCPCGTPGMESVCAEHLGEQLLLEVSNKLLLLQKGSVGNNCCENVSSHGMNISGFGSRITDTFCHCFITHKDKEAPK